MRGVFDEKEAERAELRHDTELTLSVTTLLLVFSGLVVLCGLCFGLGYATGRRGTQDTASSPSPAIGPQTYAQSGDARIKPSTTPLPDPRVKRQADASDPASATDSTAATSSAHQAPIVAANAPFSEKLQGKPAVGTSSNPTPSGQPVASAVGQALVPTGSLMVQIAAVSLQEDADVLMSALRKHGYAVTARREPLDGLIHVRIGPFKTRDEAETWRQKLMNDGYNAIVQP